MSSPQITWDEPKIEWDGDHADALARTAKPTKFEQENSSVGRNFARGVGESIHHIGENLEHMNPLEAGMSMVGAGGQTDIQPPAPGKEFKWSDVHPSVRNVGRSLVDNIAPGKDLSEKGANAATLPLTGLMAGRDIPIQGRFPHYAPPEQVPFNLSRATTRAAAGAGLDLLSPTPSGSKAATGAAVGLATEVLPWAVTKAARSKPVVDFLTRKGGPRTPPPLESEVQVARDNTGPIHEIDDVPENLRPKPAPPTGDPVSRTAGETKNLAADMEQAAVAKPAAAPESVSATDGKPTPPVLPDIVNGKALPISDTAKDAFQRFVKSKGKEGPLAPPKPKGISRRPDMQDDQAVRQEIEQRTQVRPKEPGRKGKAELAEEFKRGKKK
jgi:hypothetical protein